MNKQMKISRFVSIIFILTVFFSGCKTIQKSQSDQVVKETSTKLPGEMRGYVVIPESLPGKPGDGAPGIDPLRVAIDSIHKYKLNIFVGVNLSELRNAEMSPSFPQVKTFLKSRVRNLITNYDLDGLSLELPDLTATNLPDVGLTSERFWQDSMRVPLRKSDWVEARLMDLIEDMVVEAMLVKPYLVNSIVFSGEKGHQIAVRCQELGIVDFIIPKSDFNSANPDKIPDNLKKITPEQVVGLDVSALFPDNHEGQTLYINQRSKTKITDSEGFIGFTITKRDTIELETSNGSVVITTEDWSTPYKYAVQADGKAIRKSPWVEFRRMPKDYTDIPEYDLLCKTEYPASVWINNDSVKIYRTGIFFNKITLKDGPNRVRATVLTPDSLSAFYEREFIYKEIDKKRKTFPLWIDKRTIEPAFDLILLPEDIVRFTFQGSSGQDGFIEVKPGKRRIKCLREDRDDYSIYRAELPLQKLKVGTKYNIDLKLVPSGDAPDKSIFVYNLQNSISVNAAEDFPLVKTSKDNARLIYNLGAPRLGGPIRSELGQGIIMKSNGKMGENYRIRLNRTENGIIHQSDVKEMPVGTIQPTFSISSMSCGPSKGADVLSIPYLEPVPYEVYPDPDQRRIVVTLFGAETSSTWITHNSGRKIIDKITWEQPTPETYKVFVNLNTPDIWGYDIRPEGKRLILRVKYPPQYDLLNDQPLTGLKIAIEAGHGGSGAGAIGLSGLVEKDINLDLSLKLGELCKSMGAEIVQIRDTDRDMSLIEKRDIAQLSDADLLISIHANAGGRGYLQVSGTSTYYNNPFWAPLAESIYDRLLQLDLKEFGVVGSFNYTVIRVSQMPSILVEQAFMTHAEDEEKLADPQFRQQMAQKIYEGIIDYLKYMKK
jgi:N-acetylmuramoyl-L-alanine amidase